MRALVTLLVTFSIGLSLVGASYEPGTPGAAWTDQELAETKAKLIWIMDHPEEALRGTVRGKVYARYYERRLRDLDAILPTAAKIVRLGFHDCLPESETGAGCNGCFNFEAVGNRYFLRKCVRPKNWWHKRMCEIREGGLRSELPMGDNNNLFWVAFVLEELYKSDDFAGIYSGQSLYSAGKSRADLWAFASLVAVQHTIGNNNMMCESTEITDGCPLEKNNPDFCTLDLTTPDFQPVFRTGRSDCVSDCDKWLPDFCTHAAEVHPNAHGNGNETGEFMKNNFGLNVQEATAVLGAHSIGRTHKVNSMFRSEPWTPQGVQDWNNLYYINGVNYISVGAPNASRNCRFVDTDEYKGFMGDEFGQPISVKFKVRNEMMQPSGGPWNWNLFGKGCSRAVCDNIIPSDMHNKSCCHVLSWCDEHPEDCPFQELECFGEECNEHNIFLNVNMLNVDMGFVFQFTTDANGRPQGCTGLDDQDWIANRKRFSGEVECPLNNDPSGLGTVPNTDIVRTYFLEYEFYANNPKNWVVTFRKAFDKILENKVDPANLIAAGTCWLNSTCVAV